MRGQKLIQRCSLADAFDGDVGGCGRRLELRLAHERGVKIRLVVAEPSQLTADGRIVVAGHDFESHLDTLHTIPLSQRFDLLFMPRP